MAIIYWLLTVVLDYGRTSILSAGGARSMLTRFGGTWDCFLLRVGFFVGKVLRVYGYGVVRSEICLERMRSTGFDYGRF